MSNANSQRGFAHTVIVLLVVVVLGAVGFVGWRVYQNQTTDQQASSREVNTSTTNTQSSTDQATSLEKEIESTGASADSELDTSGLDADLNSIN